LEALILIPDLERSGFRDGSYRIVENKKSLTIGAMANGTEQGNPIVMVGMELEDKSILVAQTTLALFLGAAEALKAKYGDPR